MGINTSTIFPPVDPSQGPSGKPPTKTKSGRLKGKKVKTKTTEKSSQTIDKVSSVATKQETSSTQIKPPALHGKGQPTDSASASTKGKEDETMPIHQLAEKINEISDQIVKLEAQKQVHLEKIKEIDKEISHLRVLRDKLLQDLANQPYKSLGKYFVGSPQGAMAEKLSDKLSNKLSKLESAPFGQLFRTAYREMVETSKARRAKTLTQEQPETDPTKLKGAVKDKLKTDVKSTIVNTILTYLVQEEAGGEKRYEEMTKNPLIQVALTAGISAAADKIIEYGDNVAKATKEFRQELAIIRRSEGLPPAIVALVQKCNDELRAAARTINESSKSLPAKAGAWKTKSKEIRDSFRKHFNDAIRKENLDPKVVKEKLKANLGKTKEALRTYATSLGKAANYFLDAMPKALGIESGLGATAVSAGSSTVQTGITETARLFGKGQARGKILNALFVVGHLLPSQIAYQVASTAVVEAGTSFYSLTHDPKQRAEFAKEFTLLTTFEEFGDFSALGTAAPSVDMDLLKQEISDELDRLADAYVDSFSLEPSEVVGDDISTLDGGESRDAAKLLSSLSKAVTEGFKESIQKPGSEDVSEFSGDVSPRVREELPGAIKEGAEFVRKKATEASETYKRSVTESDGIDLTTRSDLPLQERGHISEALGEGAQTFAETIRESFMESDGIDPTTRFDIPLQVKGQFSEAIGEGLGKLKEGVGKVGSELYKFSAPERFENEDEELGLLEDEVLEESTSTSTYSRTERDDDSSSSRSEEEAPESTITRGRQEAATGGVKEKLGLTGKRYDPVDGVYYDSPSHEVSKSESSGFFSSLASIFASHLPSISTTPLVRDYDSRDDSSSSSDSSTSTTESETETTTTEKAEEPQEPTPPAVEPGSSEDLLNKGIF